MTDHSEMRLVRENMLRVVRLAAVDSAFRRRCLTDSGGAYKELCGDELPDRYGVRFLEPDAPHPDGDHPDGENRPCYRLPAYLPQTWLG